MRKIIAILVTMLATVALLAGTMTPANAELRVTKCDPSYPSANVKFCVKTYATKQADGSGWNYDRVRLYAGGDTSLLQRYNSASFVVDLVNNNANDVWVGSGGFETPNFEENKYPNKSGPSGWFYYVTYTLRLANGTDRQGTFVVDAH